MSNTATSLLGLTGIGSIEFLQATVPANPSDYTEIVKLAVQVAVGIATIWGIVKGKRKKANQR